MRRHWTRIGPDNLIDIEDGATVSRDVKGTLFFLYPCPDGTWHKVTAEDNHHTRALWCELTGDTPPDVKQAVASGEPITHIWLIHEKDGRAAPAFAADKHAYSPADRVCAFSEENAMTVAAYLDGRDGGSHHPIPYRIVREE